MSDFQYTDRYDDLTPSPDWKPHDPWDQRYNRTGFEVRDQELETYLAGLRGLLPVVFQGTPDNTITSSGTTETASFNGMTVPDQGRAGRLVIHAVLGATATVLGDIFSVNLYVDGASKHLFRVWIDSTTNVSSPIALFADVPMPSGAGIVITAKFFRLAGTGTLATTASAQCNTLSAIFYPDH